MVVQKKALARTVQDSKQAVAPGASWLTRFLKLDSQAAIALPRNDASAGSTSSEEQTLPESLVHFFSRIRESLASAVDARPVRWQIKNLAQLNTTEDGRLIIKEISGKSHPFKLAQIANLYFEPLLSQKGQVDMFVWQRTSRPGKLEQVYAGTLEVGLIPKVEQLQRTLGIG